MTILDPQAALSAAFLKNPSVPFKKNKNYAVLLLRRADLNAKQNVRT
jgi:hypothetical protein